MLDLDAEQLVLAAQHVVELGEDFRHAFEVPKLGPKSPQFVVRGTVHLQVVEHAFQVGQLAVVALLIHQLAALFPELGGIDAEVRKQRLILHVGGAERLVVIVNDGNGGLGGGHGGRW